MFSDLLGIIMCGEELMAMADFLWVFWAVEIDSCSVLLWFAIRSYWMLVMCEVTTFFNNMSQQVKVMPYLFTEVMFDDFLLQTILSSQALRITGVAMFYAGFKFTFIQCYFMSEGALCY